MNERERKEQEESLMVEMAKIMSRSPKTPQEAGSREKRLAEMRDQLDLLRRP